MQMMIAQVTEQNTPFAENSRYRHTQTVTENLPDGRQVRRIKRRFVPRPEQMATLTVHTLKPGERLDHLAYEYLNDPELFWQICDANRAMLPSELTVHAEVQNRPRQVRIGLLPGIPNPQTME